MDNPAGRLRYWVEVADQAPNHGEALVHSWADLLGVDRDTADGHTAVLRHGAALGDLCRAVRGQAELLPDYLHPELLLIDFHQFENAVALFMQARQVTMASFLQQIEPTGRRGLELLDTYLHGHRAENWIEHEQRESLIEQVQALIEGVLQSDELTTEVQDFVLVRLRDVETALCEVKLTGTPGVEIATDSLIGAMRRRPDIWERIAETKWGPRLGKLAGALCLALGSVGGLPALMPGEEPQPDVSQISIEILNHDGDDDATGEGEQDVVDGEVVDDSPTPVPGRAKDRS